MNKWEVDEHKQWSEKVRSQHFCLPLLDKNRSYEGICSNKRKSFVKSVGMNGQRELPFLAQSCRIHSVNYSEAVWMNNFVPQGNLNYNGSLVHESLQAFNKAIFDGQVGMAFVLESFLTQVSITVNKYSETCIKRTPSGPCLVSAEQRVSA